MIDSGTWGRWTRRVFPHYKDSPEKKNFKLTVLLVLGMLALMAIIGLITFWLSVRGEEEVLVPDLERKELIPALIELQERELYPKIQVRYSSDFEKGIIIEQKPASGAIVKAGRRITIVVSKGPVIDRVEDYLGRNIEEIRIHLQTLFASYRALLKIKEPVMHKYDQAPPGTILAQKPEPGEVINGVTDLELVVSLGPRSELITVGDFIGEKYQNTLAEIAYMNVPFVFNFRKAKENEASGIIVSQSPESGSEIPYGSVIQIEMTEPNDLPPGQVFGMFEYVLPDYPIMIDIRLDVITADETLSLFSMKHPGGPIAIPYIVEENSELVLYIFDKEEIRRQAGAEIR